MMADRPRIASPEQPSRALHSDTTGPTHHRHPRAPTTMPSVARWEFFVNRWVKLYDFVTGTVSSLKDAAPVLSRDEVRHNTAAARSPPRASGSVGGRH